MIKQGDSVRSLLAHMRLFKLSEIVLGKDCLTSWTMHPAIEVKFFVFPCGLGILSVILP